MENSKPITLGKLEFCLQVGSNTNHGAFNIYTGPYNVIMAISYNDNNPAHPFQTQQQALEYTQKVVKAVNSQEELLEALRGLISDIVIQNVNAGDEYLNRLYPHRIKAIDVIKRIID